MTHPQDFTESTAPDVSSAILWVVLDPTGTPADRKVEIENLFNELASAQGDILIKGASAMGKLSIGTAGQLLRVNSGATALEYFTLDGWWADVDTWVYVSSTSFKVSGKDVTSKFLVGTKLRLKQGGSYKYFYVAASSFSTDTTVTVTGGADYTLADATITDNYYSYYEEAYGFPDWFVWTPSLTGWSSNPSNAIYTFKIVGRKVHLHVYQGSMGTSNSTGLTISAPVTSANRTNDSATAMVRAQDNSSWGADPGLALLGPNTTTINVYKTLGAGAWTSSGNKGVQFDMEYEI